MTAQDRPPSETRDPSLDGVRGIAVTMVMVYHFGGLLAGHALTKAYVPGAVRFVIGAGWAGVDVFFVLSGFLITRILLQTRESPAYFKTFYVRRALRIFPLYYVVLAVVFGIAPLFTGISTSARPTHEAQAWVWLYGTNFLSALREVHLSTDLFSINHLWSLAIEEQFYLVWPFVVLACSPKRLLAICAAVVVGAAVARAGVHHELGGRAAYMLTPCRCDSLAIGASVAVLMKIGWTPQRLVAFARPMALFAPAAIVVLFLFQRGTEPTLLLTQLFGYPVIAGAAAALIVVCLARAADRREIRFLARGLLPTLGKYSYGLYVFHGLARPLFTRLIPSFVAIAPTPRLACVAFMIATLVASFLVAFASYHVLEKPFLRLKRLFGY